MLEIIILSSIIFAIGGIFIANLITYKSDKYLITEYFKKRGDKILQIKNSSEYHFKDKERLKEINKNNRITNSIIVAKSGPLLSNSFYSITTSQNEKLELLVVNSLFFFIKPKLYLDK
jgi:hypothetical protein